MKECSEGLRTGKLVRVRTQNEATAWLPLGKMPDTQNYRLDVYSVWGA